MVDTLFPNDHTISPHGVSSHYPTQSLTFYHFRCFPLTRRQFRYLNKTRAIDRGKSERPASTVSTFASRRGNCFTLSAISRTCCTSNPYVYHCVSVENGYIHGQNIMKIRYNFNGPRIDTMTKIRIRHSREVRTNEVENITKTTINV